MTFGTWVLGSRAARAWPHGPCSHCADWTEVAGDRRELTQTRGGGTLRHPRPSPTDSRSGPAGSSWWSRCLLSVSLTYMKASSPLFFSALHFYVVAAPPSRAPLLSYICCLPTHLPRSLMVVTAAGHHVSALFMQQRRPTGRQQGWLQIPEMHQRADLCVCVCVFSIHTFEILIYQQLLEKLRETRLGNKRCLSDL